MVSAHAQVAGVEFGAIAKEAETRTSKWKLQTVYMVIIVVYSIQYANDYHLKVNGEGEEWRHI